MTPFHVCDIVVSYISLLLLTFKIVYAYKDYINFSKYTHIYKKASTHTSQIPLQQFPNSCLHDV